MGPSLFLSRDGSRLSFSRHLPRETAGDGVPSETEDFLVVDVRHRPVVAGTRESSKT